MRKHRKRGQKLKISPLFLAFILLLVLFFIRWLNLAPLTSRHILGVFVAQQTGSGEGEEEEKIIETTPTHSIQNPTTVPTLKTVPPTSLPPTTIPTQWTTNPTAIVPTIAPGQPTLIPTAVPTSIPVITPPAGFVIIPGQPIVVPVKGGSSSIDITQETVSVQLVNQNNTVAVYAEVYSTPPSPKLETVQHTDSVTGEIITTTILRPSVSSSTAQKVIELDSVAFDVIAYWLYINQVAVRPLGTTSFTIQHKDTVATVDCGLAINLPRNELATRGSCGERRIAYYPDRARDLTYYLRLITEPKNVVHLLSPVAQETELQYEVVGKSKQLLFAFIPISLSRTVCVSAETLSIRCVRQSPFARVLDALAIPAL